MKWWIYRNGKVSDRPYNPSELKNLKNFSEETLVCPVNQEEWQKAGEVEALQKIFNEDRENQVAETDELEMPEELKKDEQKLENITKVVLELVHDDNFNYGINKAAHLLSGSNTSTLKEYDLHRHEMHGKLSEFSINQLKDFIDNLVSHGTLEKREVGEYAYVLEVSETGEKVIDGTTSPPSIMIPDPSRSQSSKEKRSHEISYEMLKEGLTLEEIAQKRDLKTTTIKGHLAEYVKEGEISASQFVSEDNIKSIRKVLRNKEFATSDDMALSDVKEQLPDDIGYGDIRLVVAENE